MKRTICISGINLVDGGTFTIMKECLDAISVSSLSNEYQIVALVNRKELFPTYSNIDMLEFPKSKKHYLLRFYYEYFKFKRVSKKYKPKLWLSLHDMSPIVDTDIQAVYMHNPSPFLGRPKSFTLRGLGFSSLYKYIYRINIYSNKYLIVQQNWLRDAFSDMFNIPPNKIIVARPATNIVEQSIELKKVKIEDGEVKDFVYASYPRRFKNFELICEAARLLEGKGRSDYRIRLTIDGTENEYSKKIVEKYANTKNLFFVGLQPREQMTRFYRESDCLIFPSKAETWGLPISEYANSGKPMILADLPYSHETAEGSKLTAFVNPDRAEELADRMIDVLENNYCHFAPIPVKQVPEPRTTSWEELFKVLLKED